MDSGRHNWIEKMAEVFVVVHHILEFRYFLAFVLLTTRLRIFGIWLSPDYSCIRPLLAWWVSALVDLAPVPLEQHPTALIFKEFFQHRLGDFLAYSFENGHASPLAMNTVKTVSLLLFHYNEAVEGFKGWMEGFKSARFIKILKMLVLLPFKNISR